MRHECLSKEAIKAANRSMFLPTWKWDVCQEKHITSLGGVYDRQEDRVMKEGMLNVSGLNIKNEWVNYVEVQNALMRITLQNKYKKEDWTGQKRERDTEKVVDGWSWNPQNKRSKI